MRRVREKAMILLRSDGAGTCIRTMLTLRRAYEEGASKGGTGCLLQLDPPSDRLLSLTGTNLSLSIR